MTRIDLDGWNAAVASSIAIETEKRRFDVDRECKAALERIHRSVGQKSRWAKAAIREKVAKARHAIDPQGTQRTVNELMFAMMDSMTGVAPIHVALAAADEFEEGAASRVRPVPKSDGRTITFRRSVPFRGVA